MAKKISKAGHPVTFRAHPTVHNHLQKLPNMSGYINDALREKLAKSKNKIEMLRDYRKKRIKVAKEITHLTNTITTLELQLSEEELEKSNSEEEQQSIIKEIRDEDLTSFLE